MDEYLGMLAGSDLTEWIHFASGIGILVIGGFGTVFWFLYRRDVNRNDEAHRNTYRALEAYGIKLDSHARQIRDTRAAVACCETELKVQHYPYTD